MSLLCHYALRITFLWPPIVLFSKESKFDSRTAHAFPMAAASRQTPPMRVHPACSLHLQIVQSPLSPVSLLHFLLINLHIPPPSRLQPRRIRLRPVPQANKHSVPNGLHRHHTPQSRQRRIENLPIIVGIIDKPVEGQGSPPAPPRRHGVRAAAPAHEVAESTRSAAEGADGSIHQPCQPTESTIRSYARREVRSASEEQRRTLLLHKPFQHIAAQTRPARPKPRA